jgi:hypothetical protein
MKFPRASNEAPTQAESDTSAKGAGKDAEAGGSGEGTSGRALDYSQQLRRRWLSTLEWMIGIGVVAVAGFGLWFPQANLAVAALLAGGCLLVGGLLGFLFGVPRSEPPGKEKPSGQSDGDKTIKPEGGDEERRRNSYRPNTNLEEVSDWLTKILVGVGLTQLIRAPAKAVAFGQYFSPALGGGPVGERFAICVLMYFSVAGFLAAYLWTRLYLGGALAGADAEALARVERKLDAQQRQAQRDVAAIAEVSQQLQRNNGPQEVPPERMNRVIAEASDAVRAQLFYMASGQRKENWANPATKVLMERTIPVFEALIASDIEKRYHQNWGQLGYALKDQRTPDWKRALEVFNMAIKLRGPASEAGYARYEFNRALCRINLDDQFTANPNRPSTPQTAKDIRADIAVAEEADLGELLNESQTIQQWIALNP